MAELTSNHFTDRENQDTIESIAASVFSCHGIEFASVRRAGGWTNAVWMADELVLRLSTAKENVNLLREAKLSTFFPPEVGYPQVAETGTTSGYTWVLAHKLPGRCLGEVWADLKSRERVTALQGLWARVQTVHSIPCGEEIANLVPRRAWFNSTSPGEAEASLARLSKEGIFAKTETILLQEDLAHFWEALPAAPCVLCHGDLTLDNAVWHEGQVIALLDFEFAVMAPVQLDLNHLVKCAFGPDDASVDIRESQQLRQAVKELALTQLKQSSSKALLVGYAILLELWLLELWLAHPEGEGHLEQWDPLQRLRLLANGKQGYLAPLIID